MCEKRKLIRKENVTNPNRKSKGNGKELKPIILTKIVRILAMKPLGQSKKINLKLMGKVNKIVTDPGLERVRLEVITLTLSSLEDKKSKLEEDCQPRSGLSRGELIF